MLGLFGFYIESAEKGKGFWQRAQRAIGGALLSEAEFVFPQDTEHGAGPKAFKRQGGLELRDYFAAQAVSGFLSALGGKTIPLSALTQGIYAVADAMLKARENSNAKT